MRRTNDTKHNFAVRLEPGDLYSIVRAILMHVRAQPFDCRAARRAGSGSTAYLLTTFHCRLPRAASAWCGACWKSIRSDSYLWLLVLEAEYSGKATFSRPDVLQ